MIRECALSYTSLRSFYAVSGDGLLTILFNKYRCLSRSGPPNFCRDSRGGTFHILFLYVAICCLFPSQPHGLGNLRKSGLMKIRYSERVITDFPVIFAGDSFVGEGSVRNVSVPGCAIVSNRLVEPGTYLEMKVLMPDNGPSLCVELAKIRWRKGRRFGVEFIRMPGIDQVRLGRLIKRHHVPKAAARLQASRMLHFQ